MTPITPEVRAKAQSIVDEWFPTERGKRSLIKAIATALAEASPVSLLADATYAVNCHSCGARVELVPPGKD